MTRPTPEPEPVDIPITLDQYNELCDQVDAEWEAFKASPFGKELLEFGIPEIPDATT